MLDPKEIDLEIARLEYGESSYPAYAKLADLYTIRNQMKREEAPSLPQYSTAAAPAEDTVPQHGDSDFLEAVAGKDQARVWAVLDDLMDTLRVTNPRAYRGVLRRIYDL